MIIVAVQLNRRYVFREVSIPAAPTKGYVLSKEDGGLAIRPTSNPIMKERIGNPSFATCINLCLEASRFTSPMSLSSTSRDLPMSFRSSELDITLIKDTTLNKNIHQADARSIIRSTNGLTQKAVLGDRENVDLSRLPETEAAPFLFKPTSDTLVFNCGDRLHVVIEDRLG